MISKLFGIVMFVKLVQSSNALSPILVTLSGIVISVKFSQPANARLSIFVTANSHPSYSMLLGIVRFCYESSYFNKEAV